MKIVISAALLNLDPENAAFEFYDSNNININAEMTQLRITERMKIVVYIESVRKLAFADSVFRFGERLFTPMANTGFLIFQHLLKQRAAFLFALGVDDFKPQSLADFLIAAKGHGLQQFLCSL